MKKLLSLVLAVVMVFGLVACGNGGSETKPAETTPVAGEAASYTYKSYMSALGTNWNPHAWEMSNESTILSYLETPLATMTILDSENGVYQWVYDAATYVTDVTAEHKDDLTKYQVTLPEGQTAETTESGYVFEIGLNPDMKWEDGTPINADTYIYSMKALLDPDMKNYRANLYYDGESAVAGGNAYYNSKEEGVYVPYTSLYASLADAMAAGEVYINCWDFWGAAGYIDAEGNEAPQYVSVNDETAYSADGAGDDEFSGASLYAGYGDYLEVGGGYETYAVVYKANERMGATFDEVGCYKVDDYTIRYVTQAAIDINYFLVSCSSNWLVYEDLYEAGKETTGNLVSTNYNTTKDTTMSYGPYRIESLQEGKQLVFVKNENWYGYDEQADGSLKAMSSWLIDGESRERYQTNKIVIDVMDDDAAKQAFLKGELSEWTPSADDALTFGASERLYKVDETYTQSFFFNTGVDALKAMDESKGNTNSVVLSNENFRKAFSLSVDREELVNATAGYKPAFSLMNSLYFYDVYNDPTSSYRNSEPAMQAIVNLYDVAYGEGTPYATLKEAHDSINGYNLTVAKELMATACTELVEAGLYTAGEPIVIRIGWAKGAIDSAANQQVALINKYINAAVEGSGFGTVTFEAVGNINDRYAAVPAGEFAIGYGAWGGAAFYPFRNFQVYCDTEQYAGKINETGCWDPATEELTLVVEGEEVTMTWQDWSRALVGTGPYAGASFQTKLEVTAQMEELFLKKFYRIPLMATTATFMVSYQLDYYTENYNIMYGFGGLELMTYNYSDAEWADFVAGENGALSYE